MYLGLSCALLGAGWAAAQTPPARPAPPAPPATPSRPLARLPPVAPEPRAPQDLFVPELEQLGAQLGPEIANLAKQQAELALQNANLLAQNHFFQRSFYGNSNDDRLYESGQRALDRSQWDQALTDFSQVANRGGSRADGALYWKAYALNKLGRRDEAVSAIAELRKTYNKSRWLDDASALEIEVKQAAGQKVSPDSQPDEELKLMALNALLNSDPDRTLPILESLLKGSQSPRLKERALFVLAQSGSPRAQQLLQQTARGNSNPDLQLKAIQYLGIGHDQQNVQVLSEIFTASADGNVKRAALNSLRMQDRTGKALVDLARKERDPEMKRQIVRQLSDIRSKETSDYLMELLK
jgi:hypothetical protein